MAKVIPQAFAGPWGSRVSGAYGIFENNQEGPGHPSAQNDTRLRVWRYNHTDFTLHMRTG